MRLKIPLCYKVGRGIGSLQGFRNKSSYPVSFSFSNANIKFLFGHMLAEMVLRHTNNLSRASQHQTMSATAGQEIAQVTVKTLQSLQNDECFGLFWAKVTL